ncbi:unnamed protein product [Clavelina lepadiformis]|uniref:Alpha/beta hydrolase fold-3 domain-containing protein n=1 Tax=Clavelina lepadiformis TaxID=159417 RepID=A0ABP0GJI5_CLALP
MYFCKCRPIRLCDNEMENHIFCRDLRDVEAKFHCISVQRSSWCAPSIVAQTQPVFVADVTDWLGYQNRWWFYPGNLDIALPVGLPPDITVEYVELAGINTVIITPKAFKSRTSPGPALVFYHGGGWVFGSLRTYMEILAMAAEETGFVVISPEYRRAPQFPFPIPYEDCLNVTLNFMKISEKFNVDPNKLVLIGDSAGGNLAMSITVTLIEMNKEDPTLPLPAMTTLIYPVLQMINFRLPSYQQNLQFLFPKLVAPKFWLAYIGYNDKLDLSHIIAENGHVNYKNETVQSFKALVNADLVPERYKSRGYNNTMATFTEDEKAMLTDEVFSHFERHYLDVRVAPLMASDEILAKMPRTHILVCEYDTLRDDGVLLFERLKKLNKDVTFQHLPDTLHGSVSLGAVFKGSHYGQQNRDLFKVVRDNF